jgi:hypothetical protein
MSILSDVGASLVTAITGVDSQQLQGQLSAAEQTITQVVEVIVVLLAIIALELAFVVRNTGK